MKSLIIIPCYNEEKRIDLEAYDSFLASEHSNDLQLVFVNDGSTDKTDVVLKELQQNYENIKLISLEKNSGKAEAIRSAVLELKLEDYQYVGYFDADLASPLSEINRLLSIANERNDPPYLVLGSRIKILGLTSIKRKLSRHYFGRVFATIVSKMLKLPIYDTQCGLKLIRTDQAKALFEREFISSWLFDVELIFRLKELSSMASNRIIEVPLMQWEDKKGSKIKFWHFLSVPFELLRIYIRYR